jgi:hypothetical protein
MLHTVNLTLTFSSVKETASAREYQAHAYSEEVTSLMGEAAHAEGSEKVPRQIGSVGVNLRLVSPWSNEDADDGE